MASNPPTLAPLRDPEEKTPESDEPKYGIKNKGEKWLKNKTRNGSLLNAEINSSGYAYEFLSIQKKKSSAMIEVIMLPTT